MRTQGPAWAAQSAARVQGPRGAGQIRTALAASARSLPSCPLVGRARSAASGRLGPPSPERPRHPSVRWQDRPGQLAPKLTAQGQMPRRAQVLGSRSAQVLVPYTALARRRRDHPRRLARPHSRPLGRTYPHWPFRTRWCQSDLDRHRLPGRTHRVVWIRRLPAHQHSQHRAGIGPPDAWLNERPGGPA